jgi:hypothetical protein
MTIQNPNIENGRAIIKLRNRNFILWAEARFISLASAGTRISWMGIWEARSHAEKKIA